MTVFLGEFFARLRVLGNRALNWQGALGHVRDLAGHRRIASRIPKRGLDLVQQSLSRGRVAVSERGT